MARLCFLIGHDAAARDQSVYFMQNTGCDSHRDNYSGIPFACSETLHADWSAFSSKMLVVMKHCLVGDCRLGEIGVRKT